jgi:hypothetical protein
MKNWLPSLVKNLDPLIDSVGMALETAVKPAITLARVEKRMAERRTVLLCFNADKEQEFGGKTRSRGCEPKLDPVDTNAVFEFGATRR